MQMMGHKSIEMSDHYLQIDPEQFQVYRQYQEIIDRLWSFLGSATGSKLPSRGGLDENLFHIKRTR